jgi:hypothetical protein
MFIPLVRSYCTAKKVDSPFPFEEELGDGSVKFTYTEIIVWLYRLLSLRWKKTTKPIDVVVRDTCSPTTRKLESS